MNAAVEAARAGEQGRACRGGGSEKFSRPTAESAKEIKDLMKVSKVERQYDPKVLMMLQRIIENTKTSTSLSKWPLPCEQLAPLNKSNRLNNLIR